MAQVDGTPGVQKLSVKHTDVMNFMLANPLVKLADVARHFGMTQPWLSCIIQRFLGVVLHKMQPS